MKFFAIIATFAGVAFTQNIADSVPACAGPCLTSAISSATTCGPTDSACQCTVDNYRAIYTAALSCVLNGCGQDTAVAEVLPAAEAFCLNAVGPISAPPVGESSPATSATSAPASGTDAPASNSAVASAAASSSAAVESSAAAPAATGSSSASTLSTGSWVVMSGVLAALFARL